ncbi:ADP/ATP carrier protein [Phlyctochytrium bullatum]|nr:ADP/ATP carrier protein [Phlyctochytrium bullatum]
MASACKLTPFGDACAGAAGAFFANATVFPLDVVATRLQVQSKTLSKLDARQKLYKNQMDAFLRIAREEGIKGLYSGMSAGLFQTVASNFAYFYFYSIIRRLYMKHVSAHPGTLAELALGAVAGGISRTFTTPISVLTTRQQTTTPPPPLTTALATLLREDGVLALWKGLGPSLVLTVNPAITYGLFERLKGLYVERLARRRARMATAAGGDAATVAAAAGAVVLSTLETFLLGALTKALATVVTYPYIMAKVRLQWRPPKAEELDLTPLSSASTTPLTVPSEPASTSSPQPNPTNAAAASKAHATEHRERLHEMVRYRGTWDVLRKVLATEGVVGLYAGMPAQLLKAVLCQGLLFVSKDEFQRLTLLLFSLLASQAQHQHAS